MPEKVFKKLNNYILPQWKTCFYASLLVGLLAHLYKITNWLPNWDSLVFRYDSQNMLDLGRWFLPVVCSVSSFYDLPLLNGVLAILFHAFGAVCICEILNVKKNITAGLIGAVVVSFPTVTSVMMYNYVADGYSIAFFLSVLAAFYMTKEKPGVFVPAVLIALSTGIYQAYITVTIMLVLFNLMDEIVFKKASFGAVMKKAAYMLLTGFIGVVIYSVMLKILLAVFSVELIEYQGVSSSISFSNIDLLASLYVVKETFVKCFFDLSGGVNVYVVLNGIVFVCTVISYIGYVIKNKVYKKPAKLITVVVLSILLILGAGVLAFVNATVDYHNLMLMGYSVFYLFFIIMYERVSESKENYAAVKCWIVLVVTVGIVVNQIVISNVSYHKAQIAYEKSYGVLMRIADRIDETPGAENCNRILVVGALENSEKYSVNLTPDITGITDGYILRADDETVEQSVLCSALNDYCGKNYKFVSGEEKKVLIKSETVNSMEIWPSRDCVSVKDDIIIIKLGTEGDN